MDFFQVIRWSSVCLVLPLIGPSPVEAEHPKKMWIAEPIALDPKIPATELESIGKKLVEALSKEGQSEILFGYSRLLEKEQQIPSSTGPILSARKLLAKGEDLYMSFEFAQAAATLAETAGLLNSALVYLGPEDIQRLYRARLLEGVAWFEAGKTEAAKAAFAKLLTIRPDFEPDPTLVPPEAREIFKQALSSIREVGLSSLSVRTTPDGAKIFLDGLPRGLTPLTISSLPVGVHALSVALPGYYPVTTEVSLLASASTDKQFNLETTPAASAWERIRLSATSGQALAMAAADLETLLRIGEVDSLLLLGVDKKMEANDSSQILLAMLSWNRSSKSAAWSYTPSEQTPEAISALVRLVLADSWPAVQWPESQEGPSIDFSHRLLGVDPQWKEKISDSRGSIFYSWWFWTGVTVIVGAVAFGTIYGITSRSTDQQDQTSFILEFP